ncbi:MAG: metallophosphoesterase [Limisphaerales bacterium]
MNRRDFLRFVSASSVTLGATTLAPGCASGPQARRRHSGARPASLRGAFSFDNPRVRCHSPAITKPVRVRFIADTHLWRDDSRGDAFRSYSGRMAKAYNSTRHFETGEPTHPEDSFATTLKLAKDAGSDLVILAGDLLSFPSEAAIEWVQARLAEAGLPHAYVAGNHDWHYEGMEGTSDFLRETWIRKRLGPLYQGDHPLMATRDLGGLRIVLLDNSTYEIQPEQLEFYRAQVRSGLPLALVVHIPLYVPGRPVGFGCGHPDWGAASDRNHELERRPRWRESGHTETTLTFHREVFTTPNLLGVFAGHIHRASADVMNGIPQIVSNANATGAYLDLEFLPAEMTGRSG